LGLAQDTVKELTVTSLKTRSDGGSGPERTSDTAQTHRQRKEREQVPNRESSPERSRIGRTTNNVREKM